jgi:hypothetical protein
MFKFSLLEKHYLISKASFVSFSLKIKMTFLSRFSNVDLFWILIQSHYSFEKQIENSITHRVQDLNIKLNRVSLQIPKHFKCNFRIGMDEKKKNNHFIFTIENMFTRDQTRKKA